MLKSLKPAVPKSWLSLTAGLMWSGVGIFLNYLASGWVKPLALQWGLLVLASGVLLALAIYYFGFSNLAAKNIRRIEAYPNAKVCWFAFQQWSSYPLVAFMISLGIFLRRSSFIPKPYLAAMYIGIGGGLFLSSLLYYKHVLKR